MSATSRGFAINTKYIFETGQTLSAWAEVRFVACQVTADPLADFITQRRTDRRIYQGGELDEVIRQKLSEIEDEFPGCKIRIQATRSQTFMQYFLKTEELLWKNSKIVRDLCKWLRLTKREAQSRDGMTAQSIGLNRIESLIFRLIRKMPILPRLLWSLGFGFKIRSNAEKAIESSAALLCFVSRSMDPVSLCRLGQCAYRAWLILNSHGFGVQPLSFSSSSVADQRSGAMIGQSNLEEQKVFTDGKKVLNDYFNLTDDDYPVWMFRTGLSPQTADMPVPRLSVQDVLLAKDF
ncbi:MAG: hypothetical protein J0M15_14045 [Deltaproteobacteria bacterium]|nr:hypothetical protein [Deltaproteobacteria bacterium]